MEKIALRGLLFHLISLCGAIGFFEPRQFRNNEIEVFFEMIKENYSIDLSVLFAACALP